MILSKSLYKVVATNVCIKPTFNISIPFRIFFFFVLRMKTIMSRYINFRGFYILLNINITLKVKGLNVQNNLYFVNLI